MQVTPGIAPTRVGLFSSEPIRLSGIESAFEDHVTIVLVAGELVNLLADPSLRYLIQDVNDEAGWLETQMLVRRMRPDMRLIVFGPEADEELTFRSIAAGARGYLAWNTGAPAVRKAVEAVVEGTIWAPRRVLSRLIDHLLAQTALRPAAATAPVFSARERQVLDLILDAYSNREIAAELGIEERTVKAYVASLLRKTGTDNRVALSVRATQEAQREQREAQS